MSPSRGLTDLPADLLALVIAELDLCALARLSSCSKGLCSLIDAHGWPRLERQLHHSAASLRRATVSWKAKEHVRFGSALDTAWEHVDAAIVQLGQTWTRKALPVLDLDSTSGRLLLGAGPDLHIVDFDGRGRPAIGSGRPCRVGKTETDDVTGVQAIDDTADLIVATLSGSLRRYRLPAGETQPESIATYISAGKGAIEALSASPELIATVSTARTGASRHSDGGADQRGGGRISLHALRSPWQSPTSVPLTTKPWSVHLFSSSTLALGHSGETPLSIYTLRPSGLHDDAPRDLSGPAFRSAVYAFAPYPSSVPRDDIIVSGWYDGVIRLHDLRRPESAPALELGDPWSADAVYSLAADQSTPHRIVVGAARHSALKLGDLRRPAVASSASTHLGSGYTGLHTTLYASNDQSPLYALALDGRARVFVATERRALMLDLKPGAVEGADECRTNTYERPRYTRSDEGLRLRVFGEEAASSLHEPTANRWASGQKLPEPPRRRGRGRGGRRR